MPKMELREVKYKDEDGRVDRIEYSLNGSDFIRLGEPAPEDATFNRGLNDILFLSRVFEEVHKAGLRGDELVITQQIEEYEEY